MRRPGGRPKAAGPPRTGRASLRWNAQDRVKTRRDAVGRDEVSEPRRPRRVAISVGRALAIAIPLAAFTRLVAMIVGRPFQAGCNERGHEPLMSAIPSADDCGLLQIEGKIQHSRYEVQSERSA